jgi:DNA-binding transcriptional MerR regulator
VQGSGADALTINEAAATTGWSARMLRYVESIGLLKPRRSGSGYRLYGPEELQRLSTLRELLDAEGLDLGEVGFALRLQREPRLREAIERWLDAAPERPADVSPADWLRFEQEKHQRLLAQSAARSSAPVRGTGTESAARRATPIPTTTEAA